jgi:hypothetical protein
MTHAVNHSLITGASEKDGRNCLHSPGVKHHRLIVRGADAARHSATIHPINKYGNTRDKVTKLEGPAKSTTDRTTLKMWVAGGMFLFLIAVINYQ